MVSENSLNEWLQQLVYIIGIDQTRNHSCDYKPIYFTVSGGESKKVPIHKLKKLKSYEWSPDEWKYRKPYPKIRLWYHQVVPDVIIEFIQAKDTWDELTSYVYMSQALGCILDICQLSGCVPIHAALLKKETKGVLILGPSGTGKSTCADRIVYPWTALCDDNAFIVPLLGGGYAVHPLPTWKEYFWGNREAIYPIKDSVNLSAIFLLHHGKQDQVDLCPIPQAVTGIFRGIEQILSLKWKNYPKDTKFKQMREVFFSANQIANQIPTYWLYATRNGRFWNEMDQVIDFGEEYE